MAWARRYKTARGETVRSRFEKTVLDDLDDRGVAYDYEPFELQWWDTSQKGLVCYDCGSRDVRKARSYLPDAEVFSKTALEAGSLSGIVLEIKGRLTVDDRTTLEGVKRAHPGLDIRLLFMRDNPIRPKSRTKYSTWATKAGFPYHVGTKVPVDWLK